MCSSNCVGFAGCKLWAPRVILVTTQTQSAGKSGTNCGVQSDPGGLLSELQQNYETDLIIEPHMFVIDPLTTSSSEMTMLKRSLATIKQFVCEVSAFIDHCISDGNKTDFTRPRPVLQDQNQDQDHSSQDQDQDRDRIHKTKTKTTDRFKSAIIHVNTKTVTAVHKYNIFLEMSSSINSLAS